MPLSARTNMPLGMTPERTRPYRPQTNGKMGRCHRTLAVRLGILPLLHQRDPTPGRAAIMAAPVQAPPAPTGHRRGHAHHALDQRPGAVQLNGTGYREQKDADRQSGGGELRARAPRDTEDERCKRQGDAAP
jgi:transposase InsO family protein